MSCSHRTHLQLLQSLSALPQPYVPDRRIRDMLGRMLPCSALHTACSAPKATRNCCTNKAAPEHPEDVHTLPLDNTGVSAHSNRTEGCLHLQLVQTNNAAERAGHTTVSMAQRTCKVLGRCRVAAGVHMLHL
jgi:hypothetical protein